MKSNLNIQVTTEDRAKLEDVRAKLGERSVAAAIRRMTNETLAEFERRQAQQERTK